MTLLLALLALTAAGLAAALWLGHTPDDNRVNDDTLQQLRDGRLR